MTQTVFLRLDTLLARASKSGIILPPVILTLCSSERIEFACVNAEDVTGPISGDVVTFQVCVKKAPDDEESLLLLTDCPDNEAEGSASRRIAAWSDADMDNDELRALLGGNFSVSGGEKTGPWMEVAITIDGATSRISFPITLRNALLRPETAGPNPRASTSWEWFKARLLVSGASISRAINDTLQTLTLSVSMAWSDISGKPSTFAPSAHTHAISDVTGLQTALDGKAASSLIGANSGIAPLDSGGKVPAANLPSYVDDVIEAANFAALPGTGETGKIYVTLDTNKTYRWSGSAYVETSGTPAFASQAEAEAGTNNTSLMTPLRTAEAIAALTTSGGGEVNLTNQAWVDIVIGDNGTAVVGKPSLPFATLQAAYNSGARTIHIGSTGDHGDLTIGANSPLTLLGVGKARSIISNIYTSSDSAGYLELRGNGRDNIAISGNIYLYGYGGINGGQGGDFIAASISGFSVGGNIEVRGGGGGTGANGDYASEGAGSPGQAGGRGGNAPVLYLTDCDVGGYVASTPGNGALGGTGGGSGDSNGGNGGDGGVAGAAGSVIALRCSIQGAVDAPAASGGSGGAAGGAPYPGGSPGVDQSPGSAGTVSSEWTTIANPSITATPSYRVSLVGGIWFP